MEKLLASLLIASSVGFVCIASWAAPEDPPPQLSESPAEPQQGVVSKTGDQAESERASTDTAAEAADHFHSAHHYLDKADWTLAEIELKEAIAAAPDMKVLHRDYCLLAIAKLRPGLATAEFMMATGLGDPIPYTEQEKKDLDAEAAKMHYRKGIVFAKKAHWDDALSEMSKALDYAPENAAIKRSIAFAYSNQGKFDEAEKAYQSSFSVDPNDAYSHADFAFLLSEQGKQDSALDQLTKAVELQPGSAALHVDLAWFCENKGDFHRASDQLKEAIKLSPGHASLWLHLGRLLEREGNVPEAKGAYNRAIALDAGQDDAKAALEKLSKPSPAK